MWTTALLWTLALAPAALFPVLVWGYGDALKQKRAELQKLLVSQNILLYTQAYGLTAGPDQRVEPAVVIDRLLSLNYAFRAFVRPVGLIVVVVWAYSAAALVKAGLPMGLPAELTVAIQSVPAASFAALGGAAVHGLFNTMDRYRTLDLTPISLHFVWLRVAAAPVLGAVLASTFVEPLDLLAAFGVGLFPLKTVLGIVRSKAASQLGITGNSGPVEAPNLHLLQGMTSTVAHRLRDENVASAQQLANADPVKLFLQTGFEWKIVLDLIDQAILFLYVGEDIKKLRPMGIRGAIEMFDVSESANRDVLVAHIAQGLGRPELDVRKLLDSITQDPQVYFVRELWGDLIERPAVTAAPAADAKPE